MRRMPLLSTEAINYQDTKTFKELELAFRDIMFNQSGKAFMDNKRRNEELLEAITRNAFNANCTVEFSDMYPCMQIFDQYQNSVLVRNDYRHFYAAQLNFTKRFIGGGGARRGTVDINKAKLGGIFSELPFTIYMPIDHLQDGWRSPEGWGMPSNHRFSSEEMAAIFLHEIGHFFTYCEAFSRTVTTNMALGAMSKALDGAYEVGEREVIIARCVDDLKLTDVDIKALAATDKKSIIETAIVVEVVEKSRSELGISIYDSTASEFLADQFANRHGCGRHLMTGLNKFVLMFGGEYAHQSTPAFMFGQLASIIFMFLPALFAPALLAVTIPVNILVILLGGAGDDGDNTYDTPEIRFRRIKQDTINRLKNRYISKEEKKRILADLVEMEKAMEGIKDKREWREYIATTLIPVYRRHRKTKLLQQELEQLGNNPLFVRSAELATLL